jgi:hypothetical protein
MSASHEDGLCRRVLVSAHPSSLGGAPVVTEGGGVERVGDGETPGVTGDTGPIPLAPPASLSGAPASLQPGVGV